MTQGCYTFCCNILKCDAYLMLDNYSVEADIAVDVVLVDACVLWHLMMKS